MGLLHSKSQVVTLETSTLEVSTPPPPLNQVNDFVYELHAEENPNLEIIFFHGLQFSVQDLRDAFWKSFSYKDGSGCWLVDLLPDSLARKGYRSRILTVCYDTSIAKLNRRGRIDVYNLADHLMEALVSNTNNCAQVGQRGAPVILVGHSLGGILIKQFIAHVDIEAREKLKQPRQKMLQNFLGSLKGVFYMSTPHHGTELAHWDKIYTEKSVKSVPVLGLLEVLSKDTSRLNKVMALLVKKHDFRIGQINETEKTDLGYFNGLVVKEPSHSGADTVTQVPENHITISRLEDSESPTLQHLMAFIDTIITEHSTLQKKLEAFKSSFKIPP